MELKRDKIIKALECCANGGWCIRDGCPLYKDDEFGDIEKCTSELTENALALIKELTEENAEVKANWQKLKDSYDNNDKEWREAYADSQSKWEKAYEKLELTLEGVMHFVDKWLDGAELELDEVNRAIMMREKTLKIVENLIEQNEQLTSAVNFTADVTSADTVRKMQEALEHRIHSKLSYHGWYIKETVIPEIAKEMLEEDKNND